MVNWTQSDIFGDFQTFFKLPNNAQAENSWSKFGHLRYFEKVLWHKNARNLHSSLLLTQELKVK